MRHYAAETEETNLLSTLLETAGLAALTTGSYVAGGRPAALFVGGFSLLLLGFSADGLKVDITGTLRSVKAGYRAKRAAKKSKG